jgi:signal transduction histidine kinase
VRALPALPAPDARHRRDGLPPGAHRGGRLSTAARRPWWESRATVPALAGFTIALGWGAIYLAWHQRAEALLPGLAATLLALLTVRRGRTLQDRRSASLRQALETSAARNRELERLRRLAGSLLAGRTREELTRDVAEAAADLLEAEGAAVLLLVEEGRFLRIESSLGPMQVTQGRLMPVDGSLAGWVVTNDRPLVSDDVERDSRHHRYGDQPTRMRTIAIVPLRSAGVIIGAVSVYNRRDGRPFDDGDLQLLQTLGDQVVVGLDRAAMLEESRRNELELAAKNRELERATRLKSEFLANMSHELRTPLNAIIGFSDLLLTEELGPLEPTHRDFLESILRNGRHLLGLINDVLDLSKIEAGRMTLELGLTDVRTAIQGAVDDTASLRAAKRQHASVHVEDRALTVVADAVRVRQILFNLLSNASKFTPEEGEISLTAIRTRAPLPVPDGDGPPSLARRDAVWIAVTDTGIGIDPQDTAKLFREFSQVESALDRRQQGTGLGLALCKQFVEMHGGTIGAESIPGKGSTFWFILPVDGPPARADGHASP